MRPFIRYPGGKSKQIGKISPYFLDQEKEYREPFVGGGSVYLAGYHYPNAWVNDIDPEVADLWTMVRDNPKELIDTIEEHSRILNHHRDKKKIKQAISLWKEVKSDVNNKIYPPGYRFLFLSKTCFSGAVEGGPTGGMYQTGNYNLTSRWAKNQTIKRIREARECLQDCKITCDSWEPLVKEGGENVLLYLDPPYLKKGDQCYRYFFTKEDHIRLAEVVTGCPHRWLVTVDNTPELVDIWKSCGVPDSRLVSEFWKYSMDGSREKNRIGKELFIMDEKSFALEAERRNTRENVQ